MTINPYQPTAEVSVKLVDDIPNPATVLWGTWSVYWRTVLSVVLAGAAFGCVCGLIPVFLSAGSAGAAEFVVQTLFLIPFAGIFGGIFASIAAVPTVGLLLITLNHFRRGRVWSHFGLRRLAFSCGFLCGALTILVPSGLDPAAAAFSLVPAIFGGIVSLLSMRYLARNMPSISSEPERTSESTPLSIPVDAI